MFGKSRQDLKDGAPKDVLQGDVGGGLGGLCSLLTTETFVGRYLTIKKRSFRGPEGEGTEPPRVS